MSTDTEARNPRKHVGALVIAVLTMFGFSFALIPLYNVFCEVTGLNGKSASLLERSKATAKVGEERSVTVEFVAVSNGELAWEFKPMVRRVKVHPGEMTEIAYFARNNSDHAITAQAVPSVVPGLAAKHFRKVECFCFTQQTLGPGEEKQMPVRFIVDPELDGNVSTIVLSYTFFQQGLPHSHRHDHDGGKQAANDKPA